MRPYLFAALGCLLPSAVSAQSISLLPVSPTSYCIGDTLVVQYQATGSFGASNFFVLQWTDSNFATFTNVGHDTTMSGTFRLPLPSQYVHLRVRVSATDPYLQSGDNGIDISTYPKPSPSIQIRREATHKVYSAGAFIGFADEDFTLYDKKAEPAGSQFRWDFDSASGLRTSWDSVAHITFPTDGTFSIRLTVTNANGCETSTTSSFNVLTCTPQIPTTTRVVTDSYSSHGGAPILVKTGATVTGYTKWQTLYAETGSAITMEVLQGGFVYLSSGASFHINAGQQGADGHGPIILMTHDRVLDLTIPNMDLDTFYCPQLSLGYAQLEGLPVNQEMAVRPLDKLQYNEGDTIRVSYDANGSYGSGNFFSVQLSDADGSFNQYSSVGRQTAASGTIDVPVRSAGTHYRIRVAASDPHITSSDNGVDIKLINPAGVPQLPELLPVQLRHARLQVNGDGIVDVKVMSLLGTSVIEQRDRAPFSIDLSALPAGFYWALIKSASGQTIQKFAKLP